MTKKRNKGFDFGFVGRKTFSVPEIGGGLLVIDELINFGNARYGSIGRALNPIANNIRDGLVNTNLPGVDNKYGRIAYGLGGPQVIKQIGRSLKAPNPYAQLMRIRVTGY